MTTIEGYALKFELHDTSTYFEKNILACDINNSREILRLEGYGKEDGKRFSFRIMLMDGIFAHIHIDYVLN